jgi:hypothetical protein
MPRPQPDPDPDSFWPSCDEQPGVTIRPLSHADLTALVAHLDQHDRHQDLDDTPGRGEPAPVLAVRVRASVGRPGASAEGEYHISTATGCSGVGATCSWPRYAGSSGRPTRPTSSWASPTSRSPLSWPSMAQPSPGVGWPPTG